METALLAAISMGQDLLQKNVERTSVTKGSPECERAAEGERPISRIVGFQQDENGSASSKTRTAIGWWHCPAAIPSTCAISRPGRTEPGCSTQSSAPPVSARSSPAAGAREGLMALPLTVDSLHRSFETPRMQTFFIAPTDFGVGLTSISLGLVRTAGSRSGSSSRSPSPTPGTPARNAPPNWLPAPTASSHRRR